VTLTGIFGKYFEVSLVAGRLDVLKHWPWHRDIGVTYKVNVGGLFRPIIYYRSMMHL